MSNKIKIFILILLIFLFLAKFVNAIGISPARIELDFKPSSTYTYEITLVNSLGKTINAETYVNLNLLDNSIKEDLRESVELSEYKLSFTESDKTKKITATINFPKTIRKSGVHKIRIGVIESVPGGEQMGAVAANELTILINAPKGAPGVLDIEEGETTTTIKQEIIQPVPVKEKIERTFPWYLILIINLLGLIIIALVVYLVYRLKSSSLKITNLIAKTIKQGATAKIEIYLKNSSNKVMDDIYIKLHILRNNLVIKEITSGPLRLDKKTQGMIEQNWHAEDNGNYTARLTIYYNGNKTITKSTTLTVI